MRRSYRTSMSIWRRGAVVLLYHRVADLDQDPQLLSVPPEIFESHIALLSQTFNVISIPVLVDMIATGERLENTVAITFDDGYVDNYDVALPILNSYAVPATIFVSTGHFESKKLLWWDELEELILRSTFVNSKLQIKFGRVVLEWPLCLHEATNFEDGWNVTKPVRKCSRQAAYIEIHRLLKPLARSDRESILTQVRRQSTPSNNFESNAKLLTQQQVKGLAEKSGITIGAHTHSHPALSGLSYAEQRKEIVTSKTVLQSILDQHVSFLSYPFGSRADVTLESAAIAKESGFGAAFSNMPGFIRSDTDPFMIPRLAVRTCSASDIVQRVSVLSRGVY